MSMAMTRYSEGKIHRLGKACLRFIIKAFIFFIPLSILNSLFDYIIGEGTANTLLSLAISTLFYFGVSKKYASMLIENLYIEKNPK